MVNFNLKNGILSNNNLIFILFFIFFLNCEFIFSQDNSDDNLKTFGNKWYNKQTFVIECGLEMGVVGSKDYFIEDALFSYTFKSRNRHSFTIRVNHQGIGTGCISRKANMYTFGVMFGFEYMYKIFAKDSGIFVLTDFGGGNSGYTMYAAFGVGSHSSTNFMLDFTYMLNRVIMSELSFNVEILKFFAIKGMLGINSTFIEKNTLDLFAFKVGAFFCFSAKPIFSAVFGGGITLNNYYAVSGFGSLSLRFSW